LPPINPIQKLSENKEKTKPLSSDEKKKQIKDKETKNN
jgi:hypothetical protein